MLFGRWRGGTLVGGAEAAGAGPEQRIGTRFVMRQKMMSEALSGVAEAEAAIEMAAGVLEDTAALDAIEALVAAGLIDRAMVEAALEGEPATVATGQSTDGDDGR
jgi:hypothetical protein